MQEIRAWISSFALKYIIYTGAEILGQGIRWGFILFIYYFSFFHFFLFFFYVLSPVAREHVGSEIPCLF